MVREVVLPDGVPGRLLLDGMPGRHEALPRTWTELTSHGVDTIICLAEPNEIAAASPAYAQALDRGTIPYEIVGHPIPDFGVPSDRGAFWSLAAAVADRLRAGDVLLLHCRAGIGRTGTLAVCILVALGLAADAAHQGVERAGSRPETTAQRDLIRWCAARAAAP